MKTKINILYLSIISLTALFISFTSCSNNDGDTTPPVINLIAPAEGANIKIGSDIHFDMEVSDNEMLKSYKVEIHENMSNPHDHKSKTGENETEYFSYQNTWNDINGLKSKKVHHHDITITENATPGAYHLVVYCVDTAGNESHVARNIILSHDGEDGEHYH
ncbi:MAG: DUF4625 domain-containing protein [Prevotella sp.]|jgi:hypothetical protein|nr:DUF4625 domain-containing protein [Prevotella sp.]